MMEDLGKEIEIQVSVSGSNQQGGFVVWFVIGRVVCTRPQFGPAQFNVVDFFLRRASLL